MLVLWAKNAPMGRLFDVPATWQHRQRHRRPEQGAARRP